MFKAIGLLGLILGTGLVGMMKANELKLRIKLLEEFFKMILELKGQMNYFKEPLVNIFKKTSKNRNSEAFILLDECVTDIDKKVGEISDIWANNVIKVYEGLPLNQEDLEIIKFAGTFMGQTNCENQQRQFEFLQNGLESCIDDAKMNYSSKGSMFRRVGFFSGAVIAILLI